MSTKIEWTDETWNPVHGCTPISEGCKNCYARRMARRLQGRHGYPEAPGYFDVTLRPDRLEQPLRWCKPRRVFVVSMGDLFHEDVPDEFLLKVFFMMEVTPEHTYQILTKRPARMLDWYTRMSQSGRLPIQEPDGRIGDNIWLGVTVENQAMADERIPLLLQTPAAVRFVSCEPLLGGLDLTQYIECPFCARAHTMPSGTLDCLCGHLLDLVIAGGETGPGARPMHPDWARSLRDQCQAADVDFFFKSWGEWLPNAQEYGCYQPEANYNKRHVTIGGTGLPDVAMCRVGNKASGHLLGGREWRQMPEEEK